MAVSGYHFAAKGLYANRMVALAGLVPSLRSLLIFESVARSGSCSAATREFNLTQPSASRNIAQLEAHLGVPLFIRSAAGMELTREGQILYQALGDGFQRVEAALNDLLALRHRKDVVELSLSTAFVTHWLVPRLPLFHEAFPVGRPALPVDSPATCAAGRARSTSPCAWKSEHDADYHSWHFAPELIIPVCSPGYLAQHKPLLGVRSEVGHTCCTCRTRISIPRRCGAPRRAPVARHALLEFNDYAGRAAGGDERRRRGAGLDLGRVAAAADRRHSGPALAACACARQAFPPARRARQAAARRRDGDPRLAARPDAPGHGTRGAADRSAAS